MAAGAVRDAGEQSIALDDALRRHASTHSLDKLWTEDAQIVEKVVRM